MITLQQTYREDEDSYSYEGYSIMVDGNEVGFANLMIDDTSTYIERLDINEESRNKGFGTQAITMISGMYDKVFAAPDNASSRRLLERLGYETTEYWMVDQGYGVYAF